MAELKNVAGMAFIVAEWRAEENAAPDPLYRNSIVEMLKGMNFGALVGWLRCVSQLFA